MPRLFSRFILRSLWHQKGRSTITVLGIALGVAVVVAIRIGNHGSIESFKTATESIAGATSLQITAGSGRFDELLLNELGWLDGLGNVSPVVEGQVLFEGHDGETAELLQVLGIDALRDRPVRSYYLLEFDDRRREPTPRQLLELIVDLDAVIATEKFARQHGLAIGDSFPVVVGDRRRELTIKGLLLDEGPGRTLDGNFLLMDIAGAQELFACIGQLDRLDVRLHDEDSLEEAKGAIAERLVPGLIVEQPDDRFGRVDRMIAAFHFNLNALGSVSLIVGLFLIYNSLTISVTMRREEIGMLRAVGASRVQTASLFLGQALLLTIVGAGLGLLLGRILGEVAVRATTVAVETFYIAEAAVASTASQSLRWSDVGWALGLTIPLGLVAALGPALEASRVSPLEAIRGTGRLASARRPSRWALVVAGVAFLLTTVLVRFPSVDGIPVWGYTAELTLLLGAAALVPLILWSLCRLWEVGASSLPRGWRVPGKLAGANLRDASTRIGVSVAALVVSLAMMVAVALMIASFRFTVTYWLDRIISADIMVRPATLNSSIAESQMSPEALAILASDPDVEAIDTFSTRQARFGDTLVTLGCGDFQVLAAKGRLLYAAPARMTSDDVRRAARDGEVFISESFSLRFGKTVGDEVRLPTPSGERAFRIAAVYYDYSNNRGTVVVDRRTFARLFSPDGQEPSPASAALYLREGADPETTRTRLLKRLGENHRLLLFTQASLRTEVMRIFNSTFAITYGLQIIAIAAAVMGVLGTLYTIVHERRREIGLLGVMGATRSQIRRMIVLEATLVGGASQLLGILLGIAMAVILVFVINVQSFHWTIQFRPPWFFLAQSTVLVILASVLAGLYPAARATRFRSAAELREE
ncbi:ABC transporter permease YtrF precursor [Planctomycetes bacterium Pan216]|uniref:ABC transporter permease YtrF n=1 Tax=Kolteria novifilia TaxID=2527975 RepID=A0A518B9G0_9BACT|nr:ABC transporter permease YtrF precursor [Planctomycetes bacterium Pan216]